MASCEALRAHLALHLMLLQLLPRLINLRAPYVLALDPELADQVLNVAGHFHEGGLAPFA